MVATQVIALLAKATQAHLTAGVETPRLAVGCSCHWLVDETLPLRQEDDVDAVIFAPHDDRAVPHKVPACCCRPSTDWFRPILVGHCGLMSGGVLHLF